MMNKWASPLTGQMVEYEVAMEHKKMIAEARYTAETKFEKAVLESAPAPVEAVDEVRHPNHYMGEGGLEVITVIRAFGLVSNSHLANVVKYVLRAGKKGATIKDIRKAREYLDFWLEDNDPDYIKGE